MTFVIDNLAFMSCLQAPFIALHFIENDDTRVKMRPQGLHFALIILDIKPYTSNSVSIGHYTLACYIFPLKLIFRKV